MLILFMLLSISIHQKLSLHPLLIIFACLSLAAGYVSATSVNDIADAKIDAINHPKSLGRPLITGEGNKRDLTILFIFSSVLSLLLASFVNLDALLILGLMILINVVYSLPPIKFSYRTFLAPVILGIAYVGIPFSLGLAIVNRQVNATDYYWFLGLYVMFVGRIILKDFRDRKGDAKYNKPTFLLKFGKKATCIFSYTGIVAGGLIIVLLLHQIYWLSAISALYLLAIIFMIRRLQISPEGMQEQLSIGVAAKMGNGLIITILCTFVLRQSSAPIITQESIVTAVAVLFFANYFYFLQHPKEAMIAYKG
jgi:4-hydroxybenzoate polyprenyltransferase